MLSWNCSQGVISWKSRRLENLVNATKCSNTVALRHTCSYYIMKNWNTFLNTDRTESDSKIGACAGRIKLRSVSCGLGADISFLRDVRSIWNQANMWKVTTIMSSWELSAKGTNSTRELEMWRSLNKWLTALREIRFNKTPDSDSLPAEFYDAFFGVTSLDTFLSRFLMHHSYLYGQLSVSQGWGIFKPIPKRETELLFIKNGHPVSLLSCDYNWNSPQKDC